MAKWDLDKQPTPFAPEPTYAQRMDKTQSLFRYEHLPEHLQEVSKPFYDMAVKLTEDLLPSAEVTLALRKLWEAKNLAVFAAAEATD
ncbi:hypothetical protein PP753_gp34 [Dinoroseobacter phage vB_DshP-R7L]|uniref:Uncharacterized protein n=1 Tax=Dinoroseobacter phage vB_DshP-R7L TaxID=2873349 RepID=A0AAE9BME5_9CAUD|nr:hypothetical protein PP753_gp34 [Dinoroseobacter phage vB_DshP-R7L]UAT28873.1 hypothetical protein R7L_gp34 [Dinoroseobacter phage vB_DshP-R7L]